MFWFSRSQKVTPSDIKPDEVGCCGINDLFSKQSNPVEKPELPDLRTIVPTRECDYDYDPTPLYKAIVEKKFETALSILGDHTRGNSELSCYEQANTWIFRKKIDGDLSWRMLPLHAAIIFSAPPDLIDKLIILSPESPCLKDDEGMLPIHIAFRDGADEDIIEKLFTAYPDCASVQDNHGRLPHQCACKKTMLLNIHSSMKTGTERKKIIEEFEKKRAEDICILQKSFDERVNQLEKSHEETVQNTVKMHDEKVKGILESHREDLIKTKEAYEEEKKKIVELHKLEMEKLNEKMSGMVVDFVKTKKKMKDNERKYNIDLLKLQKELDETNRNSKLVKSMLEKQQETANNLKGSLHDSEMGKVTIKNKLDEVTREKDTLFKEKEQQQNKLNEVTREKDTLFKEKEQQQMDHKEKIGAMEQKLISKEKAHEEKIEAMEQKLISKEKALEEELGKNREIEKLASVWNVCTC